tara:strand:- start:452 stop:835 length:384 start_codon:yes stop_codon:yes gene_type:complete
MLSGKTKEIFNILKSESGNWVSIRKLIVSIWGPDSMDNNKDEIRWRRNLSGHLSKIKCNLNDEYKLQKSRDLDAIKLISTLDLFNGLASCVSCETNFHLENSKILSIPSDHIYCINCLCSMMEDLGV